jgi:putative flippase GtrA
MNAHRARDVVREFTRFAAAGGVGTVVHYMILVALVRAGDVQPVVGSIAGFAAGSLVNYGLSHRFVFRSTKPLRATVWKFYLVAAVGLVLNTVLMYIAVHFLALHYLVGQVVSTGVVLLSNYLLNSLWTFSRRSH